jgi:hypothetical protein
MVGCFYNHSLIECGMLKLDKGGACMYYWNTNKELNIPDHV